ncbi:phage tail protein I [Chromobacterium sp. IIBBL 290-4]|uniref:phage tail protein I n=1 Tax=Chromobacterium sp. IIBBL 290-4 TaxID=2953890 RepID=UPI0020B88E44|nr:phage tail protein I [Chromobacterium sp. IIBBL 290-4]UTH76106.1 phage tail protein I [Chromobacterium sp. IIBBL 290-4]
MTERRDGAVSPVLRQDARFRPLAELARRMGVPYAEPAVAQTQGQFETTDLLVYLVDSVEPALLPLLAEQFHVAGDEGWLLANGDAKRRELIKRAISLHRYKGTRWAVTEVFRVLGVNIELTEWWEKNGSGEAYTFNFTAWANDNLLPGQAILSPQLYERLRRMVEQVKPARSSYRFKIGAAFSQPLGLAGALGSLALSRRSADCRPNPAKPLSQALRCAGALKPLAVMRLPMEMSR